MIRVAVLIMALVVTDLFLGLSGAKAESEQKTDIVVAEDYALYDQVLTNKFLT
jgi:nucleoside phosphorylase